MAPLSRTYTAGTKTIPSMLRRTRTRRFPAPPVDRVRDRYEVDPVPGSCMPLDTGVHWEWSNPLNIIPAVILLFVLAAIVGMLI